MPSCRARLSWTAAILVLAAGTRGQPGSNQPGQPRGGRGQANPTASAATPPTTDRTWDERRLTLPLVGPATAYVPRATTRHVVLFISGDGGWNAGVIDMARRIAAQPAVVVGISYPALRRGSAREGGCWYAASDLELISHAAQRALNLPQYHPPVLVGYSSGASLIYAALANTPAVTFAGGISLGFCPEIQAAREICSGDVWSPEYDERKQLSRLPPTKALPKEWFVLQGTQDQVCPLDTVRRFLNGMPRTHLLEIDGTGHGFARPQHWGVPFDKALHDLWTEKEPEPPAAEPRSATTRELEAELQRLQLPLEFRWPAQLSALLLFFSGDGGWASLDEDVAEQLVSRNIGIVGVSSLRYFWTAKSPAQVAGDIRRLLTILAASRRPLFIGGFSFGAEVVPVALQEIAAQDRQLVAGLVLVGPGPSASFEIDPLDWIRKPAENPATRVAPAVRSLGLPVLCLTGTKEDDTPCPSLAGVPGVQVARLPGSHHFNGDYPAVADTVNQFIRRAGIDKRH